MRESEDETVLNSAKPQQCVMMVHYGLIVFIIYFIMPSDANYVVIEVTAIISHLIRVKTVVTGDTNCASASCIGWNQLPKVHPWGPNGLTGRWLLDNHIAKLHMSASL